MNVDDLEVGMFVTAIDFVDPDRHSDHWSGKPVEILAISLPWVCVFDGVGHSSMDVRKFKLGRVSRSYVEAMWKRPVGNSFKKVYRRTGTGRPAATEIKRCPRCECDEFTQRVISPGVWGTVCDECGMLIEEGDL